jgi:HK97 family phage major capsid protein
MDPRIEKMNTIRADVAAIYEKAKTEARELTTEEYTQTRTAMEHFAGLKKTLDGEKEAAAMQFSQITEPRQPLNAPGAPRDPAKADKAAFNRYLRTGNAEEYGAYMHGEGRESFAVVTTATGSGALVPTTVLTPQTVRRFWNPWANACMIGGQPIISMGSTETVTIPVIDDTSVSGQVLAQDAGAATEAEPTITSISLGAILYDSKSLFLSNTVLQAPGYDLSAYVLPILEKRIELAQGAAWTTKALTHTSGHTSAAAASGITYAQFVAWYHSLSAPFRVDGIFVVSDGLLAAMENLTDDIHRPLLSDPLITGAVKTLRGCPVVIDVNMADPAANAVSGVFVSAASIKARSENNRRIAVYKNLPTNADQTGWQEFVNGDFDLAPGYSFLKHAAS